jgi:hypothetical protein
MRVGIYNGSDVESIERTDHVESWIDPRFDVQNVFVPFDDAGYELDELFDRVLPTIRAAGRTPMLTWEPYLTSGPTPDDVLQRIAAGEYDEYLAEWTERLRAAIERTNADRGNEPAAYLRLAHEANGNWYPWAPAGGDGTPTDYVEMWRYVRLRVEEGIGGESDLAWMWAVNGVDVGPYAMEELYPDDAFVDWTGIDSYNWGTSQSWSHWQSPEELFVDPVERVRAIGEVPIGVTEFASSSVVQARNSIERKSEWIRKAFETLERLGVDMAVWFNEDKETDWAVFGGERGADRIEVDERRYNVYPVYREAMLGNAR